MKPIRVELFWASDVTVRDRLRPLDKARVGELAESIRKLGLMHPVSVRLEAGIDPNDLTARCPVLIAGRHRLAACDQLGVLVECAIFDGDADDARLWEIAENLHRADLTEAERRQHIAEWVRLTAEKLPHDAAVSKRGTVEGRGNEGAISKAAKDLGISKDTVARAVAAESLTPEAKAAADAVGLGTVKRAEAATEDTPAAQVAHIEADCPRRQADKMHDACGAHLPGLAGIRW